VLDFAADGVCDEFIGQQDITFLERILYAAVQSDGPMRRLAQLDLSNLKLWTVSTSTVYPPMSTSVMPRYSDSRG
jgi:hypothetical protein